MIADARLCPDTEILPQYFVKTVIKIGATTKHYLIFFKVICCHQ